jgi:hypothetical protein
MNNEQQKNSPSIANRLPALLAFYNALQPAAMERVLKDKGRRLETDHVLALVRAVLRLIPKLPG